MEKLGSGLKKVLLAGIGAVAVTGEKSKELLDRRDAAIPKALCGKTYPICIKQGSGAMFEDMDGNKVVTRSGGGYAG